jgi:hypothetical protein
VLGGMPRPRKGPDCRVPEQVSIPGNGRRKVK